MSFKLTDDEIRHGLKLMDQIRLQEGFITEQAFGVARFQVWAFDDGRLAKMFFELAERRGLLRVVRDEVKS